MSTLASAERLPSWPRAASRRRLLAGHVLGLVGHVGLELGLLHLELPPGRALPRRARSPAWWRRRRHPPWPSRPWPPRRRSGRRRWPSSPPSGFAPATPRRRRTSRCGRHSRPARQPGGRPSRRHRRARGRASGSWTTSGVNVKRAPGKRGREGAEDRSAASLRSSPRAWRGTAGAANHHVPSRSEASSGAPARSGPVPARSGG